MEVEKLFEIVSEAPGDDPQTVGLFKTEKLAKRIMSLLVDLDLDYFQELSEKYHNYNHYPQIWESPDGGKAIVLSTMEVFDDEFYNNETEQISYYIREVSVY